MKTSQACLLGAIVMIAATAIYGMPESGENGSAALIDVDSSGELTPDPVMGYSGAPVTIVEYSDFECPFSAKAAAGAIEDVERDYIDSGKVKLVFKNFPLTNHQFAKLAAEAGECANEQGRFFEFRDTAFGNQNALDEESLRMYAEELGLDTVKFGECLESRRMRPEVKEDTEEGRSAGVERTPTFFINGRKVVGAQDYSVFMRVIEEELEKKKNMQRT